MIYELKKDQYSKISHLLKNEYINLEIKSVVEGFNPGWVFVDNTKRPKTAMLWSKGIEGFYFVGDANNDDFNDSINDYIKNEIVSRATKLGLEYFEFSGTSRAWDENFELIFKDQNLNKSKQFVYKMGNDKINNFNDFNLEEEYTLRKLNMDLLQSEQYDLKFVEDAIYQWWDSIEKFIDYGIGFCILHKDIAVCSCVTSFMTDNCMESHIKTSEKHRKSGLATKAVGAFVNFCKENQYNLYWECMEKNFGSRSLAEKFRYNKEFEYYLYRFNF